VTLPREEPFRRCGLRVSRPTDWCAVGARSSCSTAWRNTGFVSPQRESWSWRN